MTITFDNTDKKQSPLGYESFDEITVSRQVRIPVCLSMETAKLLLLKFYIYVHVHVSAK